MFALFTHGMGLRSVDVQNNRGEGGQNNPGEKLGSLVEARVGKGRWVHVGLGLWRQLPAGTVGAYELLANLLSLPKAPSGTAAP